MASRAPMQLLLNSKRVMDSLLANGPMTPAEIGEAIGVPRTTAYRLVSGLNAINLTEPQANGAVDLSLRWLHLADAASDALSEWAGSHDFLERLSLETEQTAFLSVPRSDTSVCIDSATARGPSVLIVRRGFTAPLHAGAAGRTFLAQRTDPAQYLKRAPFVAFTPKTLILADELIKDIELTRSRGYALADEDVFLGMATISMPVFDRRHRAQGCVSLGGLATETRDRQDELVSALGSAVGRLEHLLAQAA